MLPSMRDQQANTFATKGKKNIKVGQPWLE
jgi:hypothetical protein